MRHLTLDIRQEFAWLQIRYPMAFISSISAGNGYKLNAARQAVIQSWLKKTALSRQGYWLIPPSSIPRRFPPANGWPAPAV